MSLQFTVLDGVFAVSTYNTDYILVKEDRVPDAVKALTEHGCVYIG